MLCALCAGMNFRDREGLDEEDKKVVDIVCGQRKGDTAHYYIQHRSKLELEQSAQAGCHFCAVLWYELFDSYSHDGPPEASTRADYDIIVFAAMVSAWNNQPEYNMF